MFVRVRNDGEHPIRDVAVEAWLVDASLGKRGPKIGTLPGTVAQIGPKERSRVNLGFQESWKPYPFNQAPKEMVVEFTDINDTRWRRVNGGDPVQLPGAAGAAP